MYGGLPWLHEPGQCDAKCIASETVGLSVCSLGVDREVVSGINEGADSVQLALQVGALRWFGHSTEPSY